MNRTSRTERIYGFMGSMRRLQHEIKRVFDFLSEEEGLSATSMVLLYRLSAHESVNITDVAEILQSTPAAATGMVDKLEACGFVVRVRSEEDRRVVWVSLTEAGVERVQRMKRRFVESLKEMFSQVSEDQLVDIDTTLNNLADTIEHFFSKRREQ